MRLLWERLGAQRGEAAFLEGARPGVNETLERALGEDVDWLVLPLSFGADPLLERLRGLVERIARERPGAGGRIRLARAPEDHPALIRWVAHRVAALWSGKLHEESFRRHSERRAATAPAIRLGRLEAGGVAAEVRDAAQLRSLLPRALLDAPYTFVKVAWSGRVAGGYTDAIALDLLLEALPGRAILLEGHPSGAALGNGDAPAAEAARREWLRERQRRFLEETGLRDVIERRQAQHVNVTEAFWEEACASSIDVGGLDNPDLAACVPAVVAERRGAPLISFARFQGPTKLSLANLFELVPEPLRAGWDVNDPGSVAAVCCDLAKIYGSLLSLYGLVEGFHVAVRWSDEGLHQSEWGSYDLVPQPGLATFSEGLAAADVLAARLEGHDLSRSAFYDVVRTKLGLSSEAERLSLPQEWLTRFRAAPSRAG